MESFASGSRTEYKERKQSKDWFITFNNPGTTHDEAGFLSLVGVWRDALSSKDNDVRYFCSTLEVGENKTVHWQAFVQLEKRTTWGFLRKHIRGMWFEPRKGTPSQARAYCMHTGKWANKATVAGPFEWGEYDDKGDNQGKRTELDNAFQLYYDTLESTGGSAYSAQLAVIEAFPGTAIKHLPSLMQRAYQLYRHKCGVRIGVQRKVVWIHGPSGTEKTLNVYVEHEPGSIDVVSLSGQATKPFFLGYEGKDVMLLDDIRPHQACFEFWLNLFDGYPMTVNVKGSEAPLMAKLIYVTCPLSPAEFAHQVPGVIGDDVSQFTRRITAVIKTSERDRPAQLHLEPPVYEGWAAFRAAARIPESSDEESSGDEDEEETLPSPSPLKRSRANAGLVSRPESPASE